MYKHRKLYKALAVSLSAVAAVCVLFVLLSVIIGRDSETAPDTAFLPPQNEEQQNIEPLTEPLSSPRNNVKKIRTEYSDLREQYGNEDIIGFIDIPNTSVSYPVVQSADNSYYLTRDIYHNESVAGWIFMDYENHVYTLDRNTIIYGHNMKSQEMFHALRYYTDENFYRENRYVTFNTLYDDYTWEVFAFGRVPVTLNYLEVSPDAERFAELIDALLSYSMYDTGVDVSPADKILNLSTCSIMPNEAEYRYVLSARLMR